MAVPHHNFTRRMTGAVAFHGSKPRHRSRLKHNGRLRKLPNDGLRRKRERYEMNHLDWVFQTKDGFDFLVRRMLKDLDRRRARA